MTTENRKETRALTPKEELFCVAYADPESETYADGTASAKKAGFAETSAHTAAWRALRRPRVKARLKELYAESDFSPGRVMSNLVADRLKALAKNDIATAVRCDELMGKRLGLFSDRLISCTETPERQRELDDAEKAEARLIAEARLRLPCPAYPGQESVPNDSEAQTPITEPVEQRD